MMIFRRLAYVLAIAIWFGGFTFYAGIVIPTGSEVLGSHRDVGFITREVTGYLNLLGFVALAVILWESCAKSDDEDRLRGWQLRVWGVMVVAQIGLVIAHPWLDELLDANTRSILSPEGFYQRHRVYLFVAMVLWLATMAHIGLTVTRWTGTASNGLESGHHAPS